MQRQDPALAPGATFESRYEILHRIADGGFGSIVKARQLTTGQEVALKVMHLPERESSARSDTRVVRFLREAQLCAKLRHPNIVPIIDSGQTESGSLYTVFAFAPGDNLAEVLARDGALAPQQARHLMLQVLDALACAHAQGVIHRDLKPSNIMVIATGARRNALVLDFGIGALIEATTGEALARLTATNDALGTPGYGAPEQWRGLEPSPRADLFSWGLVFLECLTGTRVYQAGSTAEIFYELLGPDPVPLPAALKRHPLGALLRQATNKNVAEREVSACGLFQALDACDLRGLSRNGMTGFRSAPVGFGDGESPTLPLTAGQDEHPAPTRHALTRERRQVTTLCCRVDACASEARALDAEELDEFLRAALAICVDVARRHRGYPAAALGDQLLVYFGYLCAEEDDARRAARAALAILDAFQARSEQLPALGVRMRVSIGIHTDLVVTEEVSALSGTCAVIGAAPRLAAQLAAAVAPGSIAVTIKSQRLIHAAFALEPAAPFLIDGTAAPITVFRLTRERDVRTPSPTPGGAGPPLVGRDHEIELLVERWRRARSGAGQCSLITGEPGIGKSRLARALRDQLVDEAHVFLEGRCSHDTQNTALFPIIDLLRRSLGLDAGPDPSCKIALLEAQLACHGFSLVEAMPLFAPLFSLPLAAPYTAADISPEQRKVLTQGAIFSLLLAMADEQPVFLLVEDLHWADPSTIGLLTDFVREVPGSPMYVLMTARPQFSPSFSTTGMLQLHLSRLERPQIEAMLAELTGRKALPAPVIEQVARRTDGVPLFVEELTRMMIESGLLVERDDCYELTGPLSNVGVPMTLRMLLMGRLDRLARAKLTAQIAAAIGREFDGELLRAVSPLDDATLQEDLDKLAVAEIIYTKRLRKKPTYFFKHALIRDSAYESMPKRSRQHVHGLIAKALEDRFPQVTAERPELLAYHHAAADHKIAAIGYAYKVGLAALRHSAHAEAQHAFTQVLDLLSGGAIGADGADWEYKAQVQLANLAKVRWGWQSEEAKRAYDRAYALAHELGDPRLLAPVLEGLWGYHLVGGDLPASYETARQLLEVSERVNDNDCRLAANVSLANSLFWLGDLAASRRCVDAALAIYEAQYGSEQTVSYGQDQFALVQIFGVLTHILMGHPTAARRDLDASLRHARHLGHPFSLALLLQVNAWERYHERDPAATLVAAEELIEVSLKHGFPQYAGIGTMFRGWARSMRGDDAAEDIERGFEQWAGKSDGLAATLKVLLAGEAHARAGRLDALARAVEDGLLAVETRQERLYLPELLGLQAQWLVAHGNREGARGLLLRAQDSARMSSAHWLELRAATSLVKTSVEASREERAEARQLLAGVLQRFDPSEDSDVLREARLLLGTPDTTVRNRP